FAFVLPSSEDRVSLANSSAKPKCEGNCPCRGFVFEGAIKALRGQRPGLSESHNSQPGSSLVRGSQIGMRRSKDKDISLRIGTRPPILIPETPPLPSPNLLRAHVRKSSCFKGTLRETCALLSSSCVADRAHVAHR